MTTSKDGAKWDGYAERIRRAKRETLSRRASVIDDIADRLVACGEALKLLALPCGTEAADLIVAGVLVREWNVQAYTDNVATATKLLKNAEGRLFEHERGCCKSVPLVAESLALASDAIKALAAGLPRPGSPFS